MADERDCCLVLNELVDAVWRYTGLVDDWEFAYTKEASDVRAEMTLAVQKIASQMIGRALSSAELDVVFDWVE